MVLLTPWHFSCSHPSSLAGSWIVTSFLWLGGLQRNSGTPVRRIKKREVLVASLWPPGSPQWAAHLTVCCSYLCGDGNPCHHPHLLGWKWGSNAMICDKEKHKTLYKCARDNKYYIFSSEWSRLWKYETYTLEKSAGLETWAALSRPWQCVSKGDFGEGLHLFRDVQPFDCSVHVHWNVILDISQARVVLFFVFQSECNWTIHSGKWK